MAAALPVDRTIASGTPDGIAGRTYHLHSSENRSARAPLPCMKTGRFFGYGTDFFVMALIGLSEYLKNHYHGSVFDRLAETGDLRVFHLHPRRVVTARVIENLKYDVILDVADTGAEQLPKTRIKCLYRPAHHEEVIGQMRINGRVRKMGQRPILSPAKRFHVKNKSLYPLMDARSVLFVTLLEGEVLRGIIGGFSRYEILLRMRGGLPVTVLRHAIFEIRDKTDCSYLKHVQQTRQDWKKSPLFVSD